MPHSIRISQRFTRGLRSAVTGSSLALGLSACSGNVVNLGEGQTPPPEPLPSYSRCLDSTTVEGDVIVSEQAQIDELDGCEAIHGELKVYPLFNPDLRPLHALQTVSGTLSFAAPQDELRADVINLMDSVMADGWLGSFEGLEALQTVGGLALSSPAARDLEPLAGLRALTGDGRLDIEAANNLRELTPLAELTGIHSLTIMGDQLESIGDLRLSHTLSDVSIHGQQLTDASALSQVHMMLQGLWVSGTALRDLSAFASLEYAGYLSIDNNRELRSLAGLENLRDAGASTTVMSNPLLADISSLTGLGSTVELAINDNASLRRIPDFPALQLKTLAIMNNESLEEVADFTGLFNYWHPFPETDIDIRDSLPYYGASEANRERLQLLQITGNPLLAHYTAPLSSRGSQQVVIAGNASLVELDLGTIETADVLSIKGNPALTHVKHALAIVDVLSVLGNPALPLDTFNGVQTFQREMSSDPIPQPDCLRQECSP